MSEQEAQPQPAETTGAEPAAQGAQELAELQAKAKQAQEYLELLQLKQADFENFRKRVRKEQGEWSANAEQSVLADLLPILDNFERAVKAAQDDHSFQNLSSGIALIFGQMEQFLAKRGVEPIESAPGSAFDPRMHEAVMSRPHDTLPANSIVETLVKGYKRGERVLRPAQVAVAAQQDKPTEESNHADV